MMEENAAQAANIFPADTPIGRMTKTSAKRKEERGMVICILFVVQCIAGFLLFARRLLNAQEGPPQVNRRVSVIIPARNEEGNLPHLLESLRFQTVTPEEIIVVDDFSSDRTSEIAADYGAQVIHAPQLPENWTGKNWALWNGFLRSKGEALVFLDADVRLAPEALERLLSAREKVGGAVSVVPYHHTEKAYERLSLVTYLLGVLAFTSPFERKNPRKGLYGSCIVASREDYEKINGHRSVSAEILDDLNLGHRFAAAGIPVENYIGGNLVSFRMYPGGIGSQLQGFGKGAVLSTACLTAATVLMIAFWLAGLFITGFGAPALLIAGHEWALPFSVGYALYALQILYFLKDTGRYGWAMPALHFVSSLFFIVVMLYSIYQVVFLGSISWRGRRINVKGRREL